MGELADGLSDVFTVLVTQSWSLVEGILARFPRSSCSSFSSLVITCSLSWLLPPSRHHGSLLLATQHLQIAPYEHFHHQQEPLHLACVSLTHH